MSSMQSPQSHLPPELEQAISRFQRRWRWISVLTLLGFLALIPLCSFALLSFSDRIWDTPQWVRWVLAVPVPLLMALACAPVLRRWVLQRPSPQHIAKFMGRIDPRVGDRLLGAVELSAGTDQRWSGSPALREAAIRQVTREISGIKAEERLDISQVKKVILGAAVFFVVVSTFAFFSPSAASNSLQRWLKPYEHLDRFTFVRFLGFPEEVVVAHGEPFSLEGQVRHVENQEVGDILVDSDGAEEISLVRENEQVVVSAQGMTTNRSIQLAAGDARERIRVQPMLRPELVGLEATIAWPDYLQLDPSSVTLRRRRLEVPAGSAVTLRANVSRDVREVVGFDAADVEGDQVVLPEVQVSEDQFLEFAWVDSVGLSPQEPTRVQLIASVDAAPSVSLSGIARAVAVLEDEFIELRLQAKDDYGLQRVWRTMRERNPEMSPLEMELDTAIEGKADDVDFGFSPEQLGFSAGSQIELVARAVDAFPDRQPSESATFRLVVLSKAEHAKLVLQQMERVLAELDESIRQEALAIEENKATQDRSEEDLLDETTTETLLDRALDELARSERLDQTRESLEGLLVEASKNEEISDERIAEWATISQQLKNNASPAMRAAANALQQAAASTEPSFSENPSEREERLEEAIAEQQKALDAMRTGDEDLNESLVNSLSESFINRFRALSKTESEIQSQLTDLLPKTIGLRTENLPEELKSVLLQQADLQEQITRLTRYLFDDLEGFFQRTQLPVLKEITQEMEDENFQARLPALEALIRRNTIGLSTGEAQTWTALYLDWAQRLEEEKNAGGQGEGGGAGDEEGEELETMIALIRARELQEKLRQQVRSLDESYETNPQFHRDAVVVADRQYELSRSLQPLENRVKKEETKQLVSLAAGESMNAGVRLRRPDTGQGTIAIQTEVIERIAAALDQSMGSSPEQQNSGDQSPQQNSAQITQAVLEMMQGSPSPGEVPGMQAGTQGGNGQTGGGDPGSRNAGGTASGLSGASGSGDGKAGGTDPSVWPGQYREFMDAYFEAVENTP